jgi:NAD(P)-dependent dehydrogenase (short-subunit alcohol dehydrogenase family)
MVARDKAKGEAVRAEIQSAAPGSQVDLLLADLSSMQEVRKVAEEFKAKYKRLDVLVNNAGAIFTERQVTPEGFELTFATNHLSGFLLTNLLLDVLKASAPARIVNVASEAHKSGRVDFDDLQSEKSFLSFRVYGTSKLMNILFTNELTRRLEGTGVTANSLHPGVVGSNFGKNTSGIFRLGVMIAQPFMISSKKGAETSIYLASAPEVAGVSGKYFSRKRPKRPRRVATNPEIAKHLWEVSEKLAGLKPV